MHMSFDIRLAVPAESPVCKIYMYSETLIQRFPHPGDLFALRDTVGRYQSSTNRIALHHLCRLEIPRRYIVDLSGCFVRIALFIDIDIEHIRFLFR